MKKEPCQSLDEFFDQYGDMVFRVALQHSQNDADAQDITQEVFIKIWKGHPPFYTSDHEKAWILRIALNACHDRWRFIKRAKLVALDESLVAGKQEHKYYLLNTVKHLPMKYRTVIYLFYYEEMSVKEIAIFLGKNENTILTWLSRARQRLKKELGEDDEKR